MKRLLFVTLAAATLACGIAYAATDAKPRRSFVIATPKAGKINIAVLRFDVKRGAKPPRLHISPALQAAGEGGGRDGRPTRSR